MKNPDIPPKDYNLLISNIRRAFSRSQLHRQALTKALCKEKGPRGGKQYICAECGECFPRKLVNVDHISPVVPVNRKAQEMSLDTYIRRLWCDLSNLQVLCTVCHKKKSNQERSRRKNK